MQMDMVIFVEVVLVSDKCSHITIRRHILLGYILSEGRWSAGEQGW